MVATSPSGATRLRCSMAVKIWPLVLSLLVVGPAYADPRAQCLEQAAGVQAKLIVCEESEAARQDTQLNLAYRHFRQVLKPSFRPDLLRAQRAWIGFRDAECDARYRRELPGQDAARVSASCRAELSRQRKEELERAAAL